MPAFRIKLVIIYAFLQIELTTTEKSTTTFLLHYRIKYNKICILIFLLFLLTLILSNNNNKSKKYFIHIKKGTFSHILSVQEENEQHKSKWRSNFNEYLLPKRFNQQK